MRLKCFGNLSVFVRIADYDIVRLEAERLLYEQRGIVVCSKQFHLEEVGMLSDDVQGLCSN